MFIPYRSLARSHLWLVGGIILMLCDPGYTQEQIGPCPPGMSEYQGSGGIPSCGAQIQQHQAIWVHRWGAIAFDNKTAKGGTATDRTSRANAERSAVANCHANGGGPSCQVEITYHDQCVAFISGKIGHNTSSAATIAKAVQIGMKTCVDSRDTSCHALYTACSLPSRIQ